MQASQAMNESSTLVSSTQFDALLDSYLQTSLRCSLSELRQQTLLVPEEMRLRAWHLLSYALRTGKAWQETREILTTLAPKMEQAGFREEWIAYLASGVEVGAQYNDTAATAEFSLQIATLLRMLSEYDRAVQWLDSSLTAFRQEQDRHGEARALNELAWIEQLRRRYDDASQHVEQALALLDDDDPERGMSYRVQGMIAIHRGESEKAEVYHHKAMTVFEKSGDLRKKAWSLVNVALAMRGQKKFKETTNTLTEALSILTQLKDDYHGLIAQVELGLTYFYCHEVDRAINSYLKAESVALQLNDRLRLANIYTNLGLAYLAQCDYELASKSFQMSIDIFDELQILSNVVNAMDGLAMSYIAQRQFAKAIIVLEQALSMLPKIVDVPNYNYYYQSLTAHWQQAKAEQDLSFVMRVDIV